METAGEVGEMTEYVQPWVQLAETNVRAERGLTPADWISAVAATAGTAVSAPVPEYGDPSGNTILAENAGNRILIQTVAAGMLGSLTDQATAAAYLQNTVGYEVGQLIGEVAGGAVNQKFEQLSARVEENRQMKATENAWFDDMQREMMEMDPGNYMLASMQSAANKEITASQSGSLQKDMAEGSAPQGDFKLESQEFRVLKPGESLNDRIEPLDAKINRPNKELPWLPEGATLLDNDEWYDLDPAWTTVEVPEFRAMTMYEYNLLQSVDKMNATGKPTSPEGFIKTIGYIGKSALSAVWQGFKGVWTEAMPQVAALPSAIANRYTPKSLTGQILGTGAYTVGQAAWSFFLTPYHTTNEVIDDVNWLFNDRSLENAPVIGPAVVATMDFSENQNIENFSQVWGSYSGVFLTAVGIKGTVKAGLAEVASKTTPEVGGTIRKVNPGYGNPGRVNNCANCSVATDATLKGRPASALPGELTTTDELAKAFGSKNGFLKTGGISDIHSYMLKQGNGATGVVFGSRGPGRAGHYFNVVNQKGIIRFLDGQTGAAADLTGYKSFQFMNTTGL